jgi:RHS repeat-associated protein
MTMPTVCLFSEACPGPSIFTGKERDQESGNDYFGARYYASSMGRFMSPDWSAKVEPVPYVKLSDPQTLNLYAYVGNNPLSRFDATGHYQCNGSKDQCAEIKTAMNTISGAVSKLGADSKEGKALQKVLDFYGSDTKKNGVTVSFGSLDKGTLGTEVRNSSTGTTNLTFDLKQIDSLQNVGAGTFAMSERAGVVGHEGTHGDDDRRRGVPVTTRAGEYQREMNGWNNQSEIFKAYNINSALGLWDTSWPEANAEANRQAGVRNGAQASTDYWCAEPGNGACK